MGVRRIFREPRSLASLKALQPERSLSLFLDYGGSKAVRRSCGQRGRLMDVMSRCASFET